MDLQNFVTETLVQVIAGISDAQTKLDASNAIVSPKLSGTAINNKNVVILPTQDSPATMINFDVALTATEGTGTKGGIGVVAGIVSLGSTGQSSNENTSVSRVQFNVPIILPTK